MRRYIDFIDNSANGAAVSGAQVQVLDYASGSAATVYSDDGVTTIANSTVTSDADGMFSFYAPTGRYTLRITIAGVLVKTLADVKIVDGPVSPEFFGALGDGATDDSAAWQSLVDSDYADAIRLTPGRTYILSDVSIPESANVVIDGYGATLKLKANAAAEMFNTTSTYLVERFVLRGATVDGNKANQTTYINELIDLFVTTAVIEDNIFTGNVGTALNLGHVATFANISGNVFEDAEEHRGSANENSAYIGLRTNASLAASPRQQINVTDNAFIGFVPSISGRGAGGVVASGETSADALDDSHRLNITDNFFWEVGQDSNGNRIAPINVYRRGGFSVISGNKIQGGDHPGIDVQGSSHVVIAQNIVRGLTDSAAIQTAPRDTTKVCENISIVGNVISDCDKGIISANSSAARAKDLVISDNIIRTTNQAIGLDEVEGQIVIADNVIDDVNDASPSTGDRCIDVAGTGSLNLTISGNSIKDSENTFMNLRSFTGNIVISGNNLDDAAAIRPISVSDVTGDVSVTGNVMKNTINDELNFDTVSGSILVRNNILDSGATIRTAGGSTVKARDNIGYVTENAGTGSVASGATTAVITHGLSATPAAANIAVVFTEQGTADYGRWWISTITSTQFTVNVSADPGASNLDFSWQAAIL